MTVSDESNLNISWGNRSAFESDLYPLQHNVSSTSSVYIEFAAILLLDVLCIFGNLILMLTIYYAKHLHTVSHMLIVNLSITDLLVATMVLPVWAYIIYHQERKISFELCELTGTVTLLLFLESISTLAGIALDRYFCICFPLQYPIWITHKKAVIFVTYTWIQSFLLAFLPLIDFGRYTFRSAELPICTIDYSHNIYFSVLVLCVTIMPSCSVFCFCYFNIFKVARRHARRVYNEENSLRDSDMNSGYISPSDNNNSSSTASSGTGRGRLCSSVMGSQRAPSRAYTPSVSNETRVPASTLLVVNAFQRKGPNNLWTRASTRVKNSLRQTRGLRTVFTIIGCWLACWTPYIVLMLWVISTGLKPSYDLEFVITYLAFANSIANPLICVSINIEFRRSLIKLCCQGTKRLRLRGAIAVLTPTTMAPMGRTVRLGSHASEFGSDFLPPVD